ncbi:pyridine nucleotide-disulfide oxidoreductase [Nitzschia inconspicua]|uniref:Pyridine nucleotide-disulfide oxidoreductase n=1 Tax=Nitzschia inconspicua TaxID=303405 RepID=A0A9K3Q9X1_9STRA|nr:pyridine nucleotide-disulfide oxidoreductase [Nitzschia inconspicua]
MFCQGLLRQGVTRAAAVGFGTVALGHFASTPSPSKEIIWASGSLNSDTLSSTIPSPAFRHNFSSKTLMENSTTNPVDGDMVASPEMDLELSVRIENDQQNHQNHSPSDDKITLVYDFIIVGHGNAGQSASKTLQEKCPGARIAVVDPLRVSKGRYKKVRHFRDTVTSFDPSTKSMQLLNDKNTRIQYKHGILLATGARGAPPPLELFEESALSRVLELRPTELVNNTKRPMMAPETVREAVARAAAKGAKIAILGSGWEALDLALVADQQGRKKPSICFASQGPVWNTLPNYLSTELRRKLNKRDIDVQDRSYVRYVADIKHVRSRKIELHTARTYDLLDTRRIVLDLLVLSPDSFGAKGTAALPTTEVPEILKESSNGRPWYKTWSQISRSSPLVPSPVVCFEDDGRIAVNTELSVASKIYAAGGCAKYPNSTTGNSTIAGEGSLGGSEAGRIAALNMSRNFPGSFGFTSSPTNTNDEAHSFAAYSMPVWRSDVLSYPTGTENGISALSSIGVQALCVGNCDSERQGTRGFWWTNSSAQRRMTRLIEEEEELEGEASSARLVRRTTRRRMKKFGIVNPLYGIGVVYYLDNYGRIQGIMTWGLPFSDTEGGEINPALLNRLKYLLATNAGVSSLDAEENHQIMNLALGKATQQLIALAVTGRSAQTTRVSHGLDGPIEGFSMPLYRYTEVGTLKNNTVNVLKRKDGDGLGILGENLYARDDLTLETIKSEAQDDHHPSNIPVTMYPITVVPFQVEEAYGSKAASLDSLAELNRFLAVQKSWETNENRARPGKEDPIWLRPGDERKNTSRKQMIIDAYRQIMFPHRS